MGVIETFILLGAIILAIYLVKKQEHEEYLKQVEKNRKFESDCVHHGNKSILARCGEENFIKYFGKEQLEQIKCGTDTKIVESIK